MMDTSKKMESIVIGTWQVNAPKTYYFLEGYAVAKGYHNMKKALILARELHEGQYRKGGAEYLVHPLRVCDYLISVGLNDEILLSAALLHDVVEDVAFIRDNPRKLVTDYRISEEVLDVVMAVTKLKGVSEEAYYDGIKQDWRALFVKISDRCNNVSTMQSFSVEKRISYIEETEQYILPLCKHVKLYYPEFSNEVTAMKYHITALCSTVKAMMNEQKEEKKE